MLLSASVERVGVSRMRDLLSRCPGIQVSGIWYQVIGVFKSRGLGDRLQDSVGRFDRTGIVFKDDTEHRYRNYYNMALTRRVYQGGGPLGPLS